MSRSVVLGLALSVLTLAGCGKESVSNAFGDITLTAISAASTECPTCTAVAGPLPTTPAQFRITGVNFATVSGQEPGNEVTVRFFQSEDPVIFDPPDAGDPLIFSAGTAAYAEVVGHVCSDTVICGVSPAVTICPPGPGPGGQVFAFVEVILQSGVRDDSTGASFGPAFSVPFQPPAILAISDNCYDSLQQEEFTIDVTGINPAGFAVGDFVGMVRFQAIEDTHTVDVNGNPVVDTLFNDGTTTNAEEPATFLAAGPGPFDVTLRVQSPRATNEVDQVVVIPDIHRVSDDLADAFIQIALDNGSCSGAAPVPGVNTVIFNRPEGDTAVNNDPLDVDFGTAFVPQMLPREIRITGSNETVGCEDPFAPIGAKVSVSFATPVGGPTNAFELSGDCAGSADFALVEGEIVSGTEIRVVTPRVRALVGGLPADFVPVIRIHFEDGTISPVTTSFTWVAPNVTSLSQACFGSLISNSFTITGPGLGNLGDPVTVRFVSTDQTVAGVFDPIFADGTSPVVEVTGVVTVAGAGVAGDVVTLESPLSTNYVNSALDPLRSISNPIQNATMDLFVGDGTCLLLGDPDTAVTFNRPEGDTADAGATAAGPFDALVPQTIRQHFRILGSPDPACGPDHFAPVGATVLVSFTTPVGGPTNAFQLDANGDGTADFDIVEAEITADGVIEGMTPRVRATVDFDPVIRIHFEDGTISPVTTPFTWVAPPIITTILDLDAGAGNGVLSGFAVDDFFGCASTTMEITGANFDTVTPATVTIFDLNSGVTPDELDPELPGTPVRRIGTGNPVDDDLGPVQTVTATTITGETRMDGDLAALDTDGDGIVVFRVRVQNGDLQFAEFDVEWLLAGTPVFVGANANTQNNLSVSIDPSSLLGPTVVAPGLGTPSLDPANTPMDDYGTAGYSDAVNGSNITIVHEEDPTNTAGFEALTVGLSFTRDSGLNWTTRTPIGAAEDGLDPTAFRNFAMAEYDLNGNLWVSYLVDDFAVTGESYIVLLRSSDQGVTFDPIGVDGSRILFTTALGGVGTVGNPALCTGIHPTAPAGLAAVTVNVSYVDHSAFPDRVFVTGLLYGGYGTGGFLGLFGSTQVDDGFPFFGFALHARCASGPDGELYVSWLEPDLIGGAGAAVRFDRDRDGQAVGAFLFDTDSFVDFTPLVGVALPASPDAGPPLPLPVLAVAQTGSRSGRVVVAYDRLTPIGVNPQNSAVVTRYSDDSGFNWSDLSIVHDVDQSDQFIPAITSDPVTGRFHVSWYDTSNSFPVNNATLRLASSSNDGDTWGDPDPMSTGADIAAAADGESTDYGIQEGMAAFGGCIVGAWADNAGGGIRMDPAVQIFQQGAEPSPSGP